MFLYKLKLEDDCWYVGISDDPIARAHRHCTKTKGAAWTRLHRPLLPVEDNIEITDIGNISESLAEYRETLATEQMWDQYGLNKVRGGYYVNCQNMNVRPNRGKARWYYHKYVKRRS